MAEKNNGEYVVRNGKLVLKDPEKEKDCKDYKTGRVEEICIHH